MRSKILDGVERIHFYENDRNSPEDIIFPSCLTSLAGRLGLDVKKNLTSDGWTQRRLYFDLLAYTGMGFAILWSEDICFSCLDLTLIHDSHDQTIERGFHGIGCKVNILENSLENREKIREEIVASIDSEIPVIAFGLVMPPESGMVCGYTDNGNGLFGYDAFQNQFPCEKQENGMVFLSDWSKVRKFAFVSGQPERVNLETEHFRRESIIHGLEIMKKNRANNYLAGQSAYRAWQEYVLADHLPTDEIRKRHKLHHLLVGNLAEARCFTGYYLSGAPKHSPASRAAATFQKIHDQCWKIWGVLGKFGEPEETLEEKFTIPENRRKIAEYIGETARMELEAVQFLEEAIS